MKRLPSIIIAIICIAGVVIWKVNRNTQPGVFVLGPKKIPKMRRSQNLIDDELKTAVAGLRQSHKPVKDSKPMIALGSKFFFDKNFSANSQVSCATCHNPLRSFTDGKETAEGIAKTAMNAPTLINSYDNEWFFWNGRADSLEAQALGPLEQAKEHGFSRGKVLAQIAANYKKDYEELFGPLPILSAEVSSMPPPTQKQSKVSDAVAAFALATLGSDLLQKKILRQAQNDSIQPIDILKAMATTVNEPPNSYDKIPESDHDAINRVFANFAKAIAAFERTIRTDDSAFDLFADRLAKAPTVQQALSDNFGESELKGLRLFTGRGNCTLCHHGTQFTDQQFHNIGMMALSSEAIDLGRSQGLLDARDNQFNCKGPYLKQESPKESCLELDFLETESAEAVGAFKTPTLRNLNDTAPYGHDGRFPSLSSILLHYNHLAVPPAVGHIEESLAPLGFNESELKDLEAFLLSLSSPVGYFRGS